MKLITKIVLVSLGSVALLALNLRRDLAQMARRYAVNCQTAAARASAPAAANAPTTPPPAPGR